METKIFDTLLEPIFILNLQKEITYCNEPAALLCDLPVRKIIRNKLIFDSTFQFAAKIPALENLQALTDASPYQEVAFTNAEGRNGKVQLTIQPFPSQGDNLYIIFFRDVTLEETLQKKYRAELKKEEDIIKDPEKARAELEKYSKNLEKMVEERTLEIKNLNNLMTALLNSLEQGFFVFNTEGTCLEVASSACQKVIEKDPKGLKVWDVLGLNEKAVPGFKKWLTTLFMEMLPFEDLSPLGPQKYPHSKGNEVKFEYFPIRSSEGQITSVVVVATDITDLIQAQREAEFEKSYAKMILQMVKNKRQIQSFIQETETLLNEMDLYFKKNPLDIESIFRCLHTIKGGAATFSIKSTTELAHSAETILNEYKFNPSEELLGKLKSISLEVHRSFQSFLKENVEILGSQEKLKSRWLEISFDSLQSFSAKLPPQLQEEFNEEFLFEKIETLFSQIPTVCHAVAEQEGKEIHPVQFKNAQMKVNTEVYGPLFNTLIHAYRNAIDHGIEVPDQRKSAGKDPAGKISTEFSITRSENGSEWLQIEIQDDGAGVDPQKIRKIMTARGIATQGENDHQVIQHVFDSSLSTKEVVTETSGRGVGMDAIQAAAIRLGGQAEVFSKVGLGTQLIVRVPYFRDFKNGYRRVS